MTDQRDNKRNPVAQRLRLLRRAIFDENCSQFSVRIDISKQRMNNFENGYPLSIDMANRIRAAVPGITLDWLFHGDERALPVEMLDKLRSAVPKTKGGS
jgi:hypothetical protein